VNNGRYTNVQFIDSGGFAKVYRALDNWTRQTVAIKQLINPTPDLFRRFERERDMLTVHLSNPFVVDILDSCLNGPDPYLVLEFSKLGTEVCDSSPQLAASCRMVDEHNLRADTDSRERGILNHPTC
jgi:serine/threonine protein kinase